MLPAHERSFARHCTNHSCSQSKVQWQWTCRWTCWQLISCICLVHVSATTTKGNRKLLENCKSAWHRNFRPIPGIYYVISMTHDQGSYSPKPIRVLATLWGGVSQESLASSADIASCSCQGWKQSDTSKLNGNEALTALRATTRTKARGWKPSVVSMSTNQNHMELVYNLASHQWKEKSLSLSVLAAFFDSFQGLETKLYQHGNKCEKNGN